MMVTYWISNIIIRKFRAYYGNNYLTTYVVGNHSNILNIQDGNDSIILHRNKLGKFIIQHSNNSKLSYQNKTSNNLATRLNILDK